MATLRDRFRAYRGSLTHLRVEGNSMSPVLKDGEVVLYDALAAASTGDIVFARHPYKQGVNILKRVVGINAKGRVTLVGDNPGESTDSRTFGTISKESLLGVVICKLR